MSLPEEARPSYNLSGAVEPAALQHSEFELVRGSAHTELVVAERDDGLRLGLVVQCPQQSGVRIVPKPLDYDVAATDAQSSVVDVALQSNCETECEGQGGGTNQHRDGGEHTAQRPRIGVAGAQAEPAGQPCTFQDPNETGATTVPGGSADRDGANWAQPSRPHRGQQGSDSHDQQDQQGGEDRQRGGPRSGQPKRVEALLEQRFAEEKTQWCAQ